RLRLVPARGRAVSTLRARRQGRNGTPGMGRGPPPTRDRARPSPERRTRFEVLVQGNGPRLLVREGPRALLPDGAVRQRRTARVARGAPGAAQTGPAREVLDGAAYFGVLGPLPDDGVRGAGGGGSTGSLP